MLLPEDICYGCGNDHRACTCARPAPVTQRAPVAEPLRPEVAHTLTAFLTRAAERGGDVAITHGSTAIHMPAAMALSLDTTAAVAAAVAAERAAAVAFLRRLAAKIEAAAGAKVDLCRAALGVQGAAGTMACAVDTAIADGVVTEAEERAVETALLAIEAKVAAVRVSLKQHRDRRGAR